MAAIIFTKLDKRNRVVRRFGEFDITATKDGVELDGALGISSRTTGDQELDILVTELAGAWKDHKALAGEVKSAYQGNRYADVERGRGTSPKHGPWMATRCAAVTIKMTGARTEVRCSQAGVANAVEAKALASLFKSAIGERDEVRVLANQFRRTGKAT